MIEESLLKSEERAVYALRSLYKKYGYQSFKMSKFEEYELYLKNKDFLISDRIISFSDTNGKLMALKPDVTLSVIKNGEDLPGYKQKVYYNENVYRVSGSTHQYKEIMQTGIECIGDLDGYDVFEVLSLAAKSLACISGDYILDVSHLGILTALLDEAGCGAELRKEIARCVAGRNSHDLERACVSGGVPPAMREKICAFNRIYGDMDHVLERLEPVCTGERAKSALEELKKLRRLIRDEPFEEHVFFDFSIVNDMDYYNGVVFKGFLQGICEGVLAGGQYDKLMEKMGRSSRAVGFALYLDLLEELRDGGREYDVDVLLLYDGAVPEEKTANAVKALLAEGKSVSAQKAVPSRLRYRELLDIREEGGSC